MPSSPAPRAGGSPGPPGASDGGDAALPREAGPPERYGPLVLRRFVKEDGRALILFEAIAGEHPVTEGSGGRAGLGEQ
jgi:hypothetical protein